MKQNKLIVRGRQRTTSGSAIYQDSILRRLTLTKNRRINPANETLRSKRWIHSANETHSEFGESVDGRESSQKQVMVRRQNFNIIKQERLSVNPEITRSDFYIKVHSPEVKKPPYPMLLSRISNISRRSNSSKQKSSPSISVQQQKHMERMQKLGSYITEKKTIDRLNTFSKERGKTSIRVYKDSFHKLFVQRYGKDRITQFLQTEYIQDFDSVTKTINDMLKYKQEEVLLFVFVIMDQNRDGLITPEDLTSFLNTYNEATPNPLLMNDVHLLLEYVKKQKMQSRPTEDSVSHPILKDQNLTLMKYRILMYKKGKDKEGGESSAKKLVLSSRMHQHLFCLQNKPQTAREPQIKLKMTIEDIMSFIKKKKFEHLSFTDKRHFSINFNTFKDIFSNKTPDTFIDFLYMYIGVEVPGKQYINVDVSVIKEPPVIRQKVAEVSPLSRVIRQIEKMKEFKETTRTFRYYTSYN